MTEPLVSSAATAERLEAKSDGGPARRERVTYLFLALASAFPVWSAGLPLLAAVLGIDGEARSALMFLTGIWLALPMVLVVPVALGMSIVGLVRGPQRLRARVGTWWSIALGVLVLAAIGEVLIAAALLVVGLVSIVALPVTWLVRARPGRPARAAR